MARFRDLAATNGFGESDDKADEVLRSFGCVELFDIVGGLDYLDRGLEMVRRRDGLDFSWLRDWGKDDGLLGVVWWEVNGWGTDGTVIWWGDLGPCWRWCGSGRAAATACRGGEWW